MNRWLRKRWEDGPNRLGSVIEADSKHIARSELKRDNAMYGMLHVTSMAQSAMASSLVADAANLLLFAAM